MKPPIATLALLALAAGCGHGTVQTYPGPELGPGQSSSIWSNEHMNFTLDGNYSVPVDVN
jgi:hypothetical protein